ncbi:hypothetical protein GGQ84_002484 [Desulfitispora alkaliphila]|uniref:hypothetical protein n=1 Tax=Desulfitispora alkaliphila TaxID=622674 RepID=UPI003D21A279
MIKNRNTLLYLSISINIILLLAFASLYYNVTVNYDLNRTSLQNIKGFYQSTQYLPDVYNYTFKEEEAGKGEYTININYNAEIGKYERYKDNIYILNRKKGLELIVLLNEGFYIYDNETNRIVKMSKISDTPTYINKPYWNIKN